jgi:hypothetical protein
VAPSVDVGNEKGERGGAGLVGWLACWPGRGHGPDGQWAGEREKEIEFKFQN